MDKKAKRLENAVMSFVDIMEEVYKMQQKEERENRRKWNKLCKESIKRESNLTIGEHNV